MCVFQTTAVQLGFGPLVRKDPKAKPKKYKYTAFYDPYGPRPPPSDKIIQLAEQIASLTLEERIQIGPVLIDTLGSQVGAGAGSSKDEEKTTFDVKSEKFKAAAKIKVSDQRGTCIYRSGTEGGLSIGGESAFKCPLSVILNQQVTKEEANNIIDKIKAAGGV
ncbi:Ribosomal protein L12/ ATP-dependent Clp protease adaptor protein ClpS family protein [Forsythia ovata]|uniref:Ribosomal protein L12/ ATP-dependent Clp protease adaptor protein ClpS family protein n=1 Tax=Forsythia ovata TaxID=205694 RepID=A0ABD1V010_9LAMI